MSEQTASDVEPNEDARIDDAILTLIAAAREVAVYIGQNEVPPSSVCHHFNVALSAVEHRDA